ncbi:MAG: glycosyltransferase N-terminal domain-containing protein [Phycisphaeraceae bacterium]
MPLLRDIFYGFAAAITSPIWGYHLLRTGKWRTDWAGRFGKVPAGAMNGRGEAGSGKGPTIMIHAVSVGEINATRLLVKQLDEAFAGKCRIVITATTNTGIARANELYEGRHIVLRYPLDLTRSVRRFLDAVKPDLVALMELELWPTFVQECDRRKIPIGVINGRLSERSFKGYRFFRAVIRSAFRRLTFAAVQTKEYAERFIGLGTDPARVQVADSMKWDTANVADAASVSGANELAAAMGIDPARPLIVCGSTGPGEEELLVAARPAGVQMMIVPRKPERFNEVAATMQRLAPDQKLVRRTEHADGSTRAIDGSELFLLDTMGELRKAYALADVVIVGRSFIDLYGSDPMEPAAIGKPVIIGPHHGDFKDAIDTLKAAEGIIISDQPCEAASGLLADRDAAARLASNGQKSILSRQGATARHVKLIVDQLNRNAAKTHA